VQRLKGIETGLTKEIFVLSKWKPRIFKNGNSNGNVLVCFSLAESGGLPDLVQKSAQKSVICPLCMGHFTSLALIHTTKHYGSVKPSRGKAFPYDATYLFTENVDWIETLLALDFDYDNIRCVKIRCACTTW